MTLRKSPHEIYYPTFPLLRGCCSQTALMLPYKRPIFALFAPQRIANYSPKHRICKLSSAIIVSVSPVEREEERPGLEPISLGLKSEPIRLN